MTKMQNAMLKDSRCVYFTDPNRSFHKS